MPELLSQFSNFRFGYLRSSINDTAICSSKKSYEKLPYNFIIIIFSFLFLALSTTCEPEELVRILNDLFARFDKLASVSTNIYQT